MVEFHIFGRFMFIFLIDRAMFSSVMFIFVLQGLIGDMLFGIREWKGLDSVGEGKETSR